MLLKQVHHIALIALLCFIFILEQGDNRALHNLLTFHQESLPQEIWRIFTGHWSHLGLNHWLLNISGLILLVLSFRHEANIKRDIITLFFLHLGTSLGLYFFSQIKTYVGFSGVLHGYWIFYLLVTFKQTPWINGITTALIIIKILFEQQGWYSQTETAVLIGGPVATSAHLWGSISGILALLIYKSHLLLQETILKK